MPLPPLAPDHVPRASLGQRHAVVLHSGFDGAGGRDENCDHDCECCCGGDVYGVGLWDQEDP